MLYVMKPLFTHTQTPHNALIPCFWDIIMFILIIWELDQLMYLIKYWCKSSRFSSLANPSQCFFVNRIVKAIYSVSLKKKKKVSQKAQFCDLYLWTHTNKFYPSSCVQVLKSLLHNKVTNSFQNRIKQKIKPCNFFIIIYNLPYNHILFL